MKMLWEWVLPDVPWNQRRWQAFVGKRIVCERYKVPMVHGTTVKPDSPGHLVNRLAETFVCNGLDPNCE
jgi:hypothetical protein